MQRDSFFDRTTIAALVQLGSAIAVLIWLLAQWLR